MSKPRSNADVLPATVVVIGGGPAGEVIAGRVADRGLEMVLVERELVGGECSYCGCIPSKTLVRPGDVLAAARRVPGAAGAVTGQVDVAAALARRDHMTSSWMDAGQERWLADRGVRLVRGAGRLVGEREVEVDGGPRVRARRAVVLATGSSAVVPPVPGLAEARPWDNRSATAAKEIPARLLVLGGGAVGVELAQAFSRLGSSEVTVVEGLPRLLAPRSRSPASSCSRHSPAKASACGSAPSSRRSAARAPTARCRPRSPTATRSSPTRCWSPPGADRGRPTSGWTAWAWSRAGRWRSTTGCAVGVPGEWLYAIGDCTGLAPFTHMGKYHARIAADVITGRDARDRASRDAVPRVTFTDPQVAAVGLTAAEADRRGIPVRVVDVDTAEVPGSYVLGEDREGTTRLVVDERRGVLVGVTITGDGVQELLHAATIAVAARVPLDELWHAVPAFPTVSEVWLHALEAAGF